MTTTPEREALAAEAKRLAGRYATHHRETYRHISSSSLPWVSLCAAIDALAATPPAAPAAASDEREALRLLEKFVEVAEEEWSHYHHTAVGRKWLIETRAFLAARAPQAAVELPLGAIVNGRVHAERLEMGGFECDAGNLQMCSDWHEFRRCFEHLAEWAQHQTAPQHTAQAEAAPELWRHIKTGGIYEWLMSVVSEHDGETLVVYRSVEANVRWARPSTEFYDGRFERVAQPSGESK